MKNKHIMISITIGIIATVIASLAVVIEFIDLCSRTDANERKQNVEARLLQEVYKEYDGLLTDFTYTVTEQKSVEKTGASYYLVTIYRDVYKAGIDEAYYAKYNHAIDFYLCNIYKGNVNCDYIGTKYFER